ncbi:MAG: DUF1254 domain-containing protein [Sandarakinorhabdus sp.]|nr:DUF1254 domain-containing protein [Sandarakinorhabdus sp.]
MRHLQLFVTALLIGTSVAPGLAAPAKPAAKVAKPAAKAGPAKPAPKAAPKPAAPAIIAPLPDTPEIAELRSAFRFAFPIYEILRTRAAQLGRARDAGFPNAVNLILPRLTLADATSRDVTTPNNDTLYGSVWLDLAAGPIILNVPSLPGRYNSAALMSLTTDNTAILGTRTGGQGGRYALVGPGFTGSAPEGATLVRSATNDAWLLIRVLVNGPKDLEDAGKALGAFTIDLPEGRGIPVPTAATAPPKPTAAQFVTAVTEALTRSADAPALVARAVAHAGLGIGASWDGLTADQKSMWTKSLPALVAELKPGLASASDLVDGWSYPHIGVGDSGGDDNLRSYIALGGLGALPRTEAMYLSANTDAAGAPLSGAKAYTVTLPPRLPVGAFWSLTLYQIEPDGRLFFVPNPLGRFAIGDRSPEMRPNRDASIDIFVQATQPTGERVVNWLPAPKGRFALVFRAYLPKAELLDGSFRLPPVAVTELIE